MILSGIVCVTVSLIPAGTERTGNDYAEQFLLKGLVTCRQVNQPFLYIKCQSSIIPTSVKKFHCFPSNGSEWWTLLFMHR